MNSVDVDIVVVWRGALMGGGNVVCFSRVSACGASE